MREKLCERLEGGRIRNGQWASETGSHTGVFLVRVKLGGALLRIISSDGLGWEHVSVSTPTRCPTWDEMCEVKRMFWAPHEAVMQLHPRASEYVENHPHCLHLWRPTEVDIPLPPSILVGVKDAGLIEHVSRGGEVVFAPKRERPR